MENFDSDGKLIASDTKDASSILSMGISVLQSSDDTDNPGNNADSQHFLSLSRWLIDSADILPSRASNYATKFLQCGLGSKRRVARRQSRQQNFFESLGIDVDDSDEIIEALVKEGLLERPTRNSPEPSLGSSRLPILSPSTQISTPGTQSIMNTYSSGENTFKHDTNSHLVPVVDQIMPVTTITKKKKPVEAVSSNSESVTVAKLLHALVVKSDQQQVVKAFNRIIQMITSNTANQAALGKAGVCELIASLLQNYYQTSKVCMTGLEAAILLCHCGENHEIVSSPNIRFFGSSNMPNALAAIIQSHLTKEFPENLMVLSCQLICILSSLEDLREKIDSRVTISVIQLLLKNTKKVKIVHWACQSIKSLSNGRKMALLPEKWAKRIFGESADATKVTSAVRTKEADTEAGGGGKSPTPGNTGTITLGTTSSNSREHFGETDQEKDTPSLAVTTGSSSSSSNIKKRKRMDSSYLDGEKDDVDTTTAATNRQRQKKYNILYGESDDNESSQDSDNNNDNNDIISEHEDEGDEVENDDDDDDDDVRDEEEEEKEEEGSDGNKMGGIKIRHRLWSPSNISQSSNEALVSPTLTSHSSMSTKATPPSTPLPHPNLPPSYRSSELSAPSEDKRVVMLKDSVKLEDLSIGLNALQNLREFGFCKQHYDQMRPLKYQIMVVDSPAQVHSIDVHYEILVRLSLTLFARNPDHFAVVHRELYKAAVQTGYSKKAPNERFLTPELCDVIKNNVKVQNTLKRVNNKLKNKINYYCSFTNTIQLKFITSKLRCNLRKCLDELLSFRLYQMESMAVRLEDASVVTNDAVSSNGSHSSFKRLSCDKYSYEWKNENIHYYLYSLLEAICFQCGFFTWEDIQQYSFNELVTIQQEVHVLATLHFYQASNAREPFLATKNSSAKQEKVTKLKKQLQKLVMLDRYYYQKAPLFRSTITEFRQSYFQSTGLLTNKFLSPLEQEEGASSTLQGTSVEEEEVTDEEKLYRAFMMNAVDAVDGDWVATITTR